MATAQPRRSQTDRHFRPGRASPRRFFHGKSVNSTPWTYFAGVFNFFRGVFSFFVARIWTKEWNWSFSSLWSVSIISVLVNFYHLREKRGPLSRSVVGVRLGRLIWAHSGPAQWTSSLCSTARLRSGLPQRQPALLQPRGHVFPAAQLLYRDTGGITDCWMDSF